MNDTSCRWCLDTLPDSPLTDLIGTGGEETGQVQNLTHGGNHLGKTRLGFQFLALLLRGGFVAHESQTFLKCRRYGDQRFPWGFVLDPVKDLGKVLVLLADIVLLAQVDQIDHRLGSQKEERVDGLDLIIIVSCKSFQNDADCVNRVTMIGKSVGTSSHMTSTLEL